MNWRTYAPFLDVGSHDFEALAKFLDNSAGVCRRFKSLKEIIRAGENIFDTRPTAANQQRRGHSAAGIHAAEDESLLHVFAVTAPGSKPRALLRRVAHQQTHLCGIQTGGTARCGRSAKQRSDTVSAAMRLTFVALADDDGEARAHVVSQGHGSQEMFSADAKLFSESQCCGNHRAARMRLRSRMRIIGLVGMR